MSDEVEVIEEPVMEDEPESEPEPTPEPPLLSYEYQPTDENGRPIGGKQVIKYHTHDELVGKLQEQNVLILRKLRQETRKNRLGVMDEETLPDDTPRFRAPLEFKKRDLSPDERVKLSRDMLDPELFDEAFDTALEAKLGAKPDEIRATLQAQQDEHLRMMAKIETDSFLANNPDYYKCQENYEAITGWMVKRNLDPVRQNFQLAYDTLKALDVLTEAGPTDNPKPKVIALKEEPVPEPEQIVATPAPTPAPRVGSGLTRKNADDQGTTRSVADEVTYEVVDPYSGAKKIFRGMQAIDAMPSDEYKRRLNSDPTFVQKVDKIEAEAASKRGRPSGVRPGTTYEINR